MAYTLLGIRHEAQTFREILLGVCATLYERSPADFEEVLGLRGKVRPYFSRNPDDLRMPGLVSRSSIYVEMNSSADAIAERCRLVMRLLGLDPRQFEVEIC